MYIVKGSIHIDKYKGESKSREGRYIISRLEMIAEDYREAKSIETKFRKWLEDKNKSIKGQISYSIECLEDIGKSRDINEFARRKGYGSGKVIESNF